MIRQKIGAHANSVINFTLFGLFDLFLSSFPSFPKLKKYLK